MKIPFDITKRPQIESGEYKVEIRDGRPARILCWDKVDECGQYIVALVQYTPEHEDIISVCEDGIYKGTYGHGYDLFIITPGPELNEFEQAVKDLCWKIGMGEVVYKDDIIKKTAAELLDLARKELIEEQYTSDPRKTDLYKLGKAEALKDLPKWKPAARAYDGDRLPRIDWMLNRLVARFEEGIYYLDIKELYKLPGFKED